LQYTTPRYCVEKSCPTLYISNNCHWKTALVRSQIVSIISNMIQIIIIFHLNIRPNENVNNIKWSKTKSKYGMVKYMDKQMYSVFLYFCSDLTAVQIEYRIEQNTTMYINIYLKQNTYFSSCSLLTNDSGIFSSDVGSKTLPEICNIYRSCIICSEG
jgi:hypothetical protein